MEDTVSPARPERSPAMFRVRRSDGQGTPMTNPRDSDILVHLYLFCGLLAAIVTVVVVLIVTWPQ
jgi:hypothetical protein